MERPEKTTFKTGRWHVRPFWQISIVVASVAILLLLFSDKAFHMDDTLFICVARQVVQSPLDFFGFTGNWGGTEEEARRFIKNPPLVSYYIALAGTVFGWSERAMHAAMMVPAALAATGAWLLAGSTEYLEELRAPTLSWASTMGLDSGAGVYASEWGPVPYRFGRSTDEVFVITRAR